MLEDPILALKAKQAERAARISTLTAGSDDVDAEKKKAQRLEALQEK